MLIIVCSCLVCDPVMGDEGKLYVPEELVHVYREKVKRNLKKQSDRVLSIWSFDNLLIYIFKTCNDIFRYNSSWVDMDSPDGIILWLGSSPGFYVDS